MSKQQASVKPSLTQLSDATLKQKRDVAVKDAENIFNEYLEMAKAGSNNKVLEEVAIAGNKFYHCEKKVIGYHGIQHIFNYILRQNGGCVYAGSNAESVNCGNGVSLIVMKLNEKITNDCDFTTPILRFRIEWN